ncbi:MAG: TMEM165/GDT1 family protein [Elusimicrobiota bacterium]|jgi:putative Ca2+/H+ antiporter (TMEM165/GDT1 family)|nr:TMEM165/GDT1 family protein [Elusimicrobiota bacterium]
MFEIFFSSFIVVFLAEMGDKTQIMSLSFSARYGLWTTLSAIFAAILINTLIAIAAGTFIFKIFSGNTVQILAYALFIFFGVWTLIKKSGDNKEEKEKSLIINPFITIAVFFIIAEMGDKTQIATMLLSIQNRSTIPIFLGASAGLFAANLIAVAAGVLLKKKIPYKTIKILSAIIFIAIGSTGVIKLYFGK